MNYDKESIVEKILKAKKEILTIILENYKKGMITLQILEVSYYPPLNDPSFKKEFLDGINVNDLDCQRDKIKRCIFSQISIDSLSLIDSLIVNNDFTLFKEMPTRIDNKVQYKDWSVSFDEKIKEEIKNIVDKLKEDIHISVQ